MTIFERSDMSARNRERFHSPVFPARLGPDGSVPTWAQLVIACVLAGRLDDYQWGAAAVTEVPLSSVG